MLLPGNKNGCVLLLRWFIQSALRFSFYTCYCVYRLLKWQQFLFTLLLFPELVYLSSFSCFLTGLFFPSVFWALSLVDKWNQSKVFIGETCRWQWNPLWYIPILPGLSAWKQSSSGVGMGVGGAQSRECDYTAEELTTVRSPVPLHTSWLRYILVTKHIFPRSSGTLHCSPSRPPTVSHSTPSTCRRGQRASQGLRRPSVNKSSNKNSLFSNSVSSHNLIFLKILPIILKSSTFYHLLKHFFNIFS